MLCLISAFVFISCTSELKLTVVEEQNYEELKEELLELNSTIPVADNLQTKGEFGKKLLKVALSDGIAAFKYACDPLAITLSSLGTAAIEFIGLLFKKGNSGCCISDLVHSEDFALSNTSGSGEIHNRLIYSLIDKHGESLFEKNIDDIAQLLATEYSAETGCELSDCSLSTNKIQEVKQLIEAFESSNSFEEFCEQNTSSEPEDAKLMEIYEVVMEGYNQIDIKKDGGNYGNSATRIINNSSISSKSKAKLTDAITVADASVRLWK